MNIKEIVNDGVFRFAEILKNPVMYNQTYTMFAFKAEELGFCLVGLTQIGSDLEYFDLKCRFFLGKINSEELNPYNTLQINNDTNDAKYGIAVLEKNYFLTATDQYRLLTSWGKQEIIDAIRMRFGGYLAVPKPFLIIPGIMDYNYELYLILLERYGFDKLLSINDIVNYELYEKEI